MGAIIPIRGRERKKLRQQSKELYEEQGWSSGMIAKKFGKSSSTIMILLREAGVTIRTKGEAQAMQGVRNRAVKASSK